MTLRVAVRADSGPLIGGGHVIRCLALADELGRLGADVRFASRDPAGATDRLLGGRVPLLRIGDPGRPGEGCAGDARDTIAALRQDGFVPDWCVVDHYGLDAEWEAAIRREGPRVAAIDDLADRRHDCHLLLDQNLVSGPERRYRHLVPDDCTMLLGPSYALLRREFAARRRNRTVREGRLARILVSYGAADRCDETGKALAALRDLALPAVQVTVVAGALNAHRSSLEDLCRSWAAAEFRLDPPSMAELMEGADLALGGSGITTWERCCLGLPSLVTAANALHADIARNVEAHGAARFLGMRDDVGGAAIARAVSDLWRSPGGLCAMAEAGRRIADGLGAARVAEAIAGFRVDVALPDDVLQLWRWANDPVVRASAFNPDPIPLEDHRAWFARRLADSDCLILVGRLRGTPVGQIRLERRDGACEIDVSVAAGERGRGFGLRLMRQALDRLAARWPELPAVGLVKSENSASLGLFRQSGFREGPSDRAGVVRFSLPAAGPSRLPGEAS